MRERAETLLALALVIAGCDTSDPGGLCRDAAWSRVRGDLDRSALSIWGDADDDVYVVGGPLGAPGGALFMHWDGQGLSEIPTGSTETLWWVWGAPVAGTDIWMVGENGTILRYDGVRVSAVSSGTTAHLYGVWGSAANDVYIVGGRPGPEDSPDDVVLHWDGMALTPVALPEAKGAAMFKVWGAGPDEVWVTGEAGTVWHKKASGWVDESPQLATLQTVSTVHGCSASEVYAVGGQNLWTFDGASWKRIADTEILAIAAGVSCGAAAVVVVGSGGLKLRLDRGDGRWHDETLMQPYDTDFHGSWVSPGGDLWAAGGNYIAPASQIDHRIGVIARRGCR